MPNTFERNYDEVGIVDLRPAAAELLQFRGLDGRERERNRDSETQRDRDIQTQTETEPEPETDRQTEREREII